MTDIEPEILDPLLREDRIRTFAEVNFRDEFLQNWHVDCLCWNLEKCYRRDITRPEHPATAPLSEVHLCVGRLSCLGAGPGPDVQADLR